MQSHDLQPSSKYEMRLFEVEGGVVPDLRKFVTPKLVDDIIQSGHWVNHGDTLEDWLDTSMYASDNAKRLGIDPSIEDKPFQEIRYTPDFRKCVADWIEVAACQFNDVLHHGQTYDNVPPFGPNMPLYRCMDVDEEWLQKPNPRFGIYWSAVPNQAQRFLNRELKGVRKVMMKVRAADVSINWYETFRSRLDYSNGSDEQEFQLEPGSPLRDVTIQILDGSKAVVVKSGRA